MCFKETKKKFEEYLLTLGYSKTTVAWYQLMMSRLEKFMSKHGEAAYTAGTGAAYLQKGCEAGQSIHSFNAKRLAIRRLDDFITGKYVFKASKNKSVPDCFSEKFGGYIAYLRLTGLRESTIKMKHYQCVKFLEDFYHTPVYSLSEITPKAIYHVFSKSSSKINLVGTLRLGY